MLIRFAFSGLLVVSVATQAATFLPTITTPQLVARVTAAIQTLKFLRCQAEARERISNKLVADNTAMKITFNPYRVYLKNRKNVEVLYVSGQNSNEAWVYPAAFPYITLSLDPNGSLMRKGQHRAAGWL